MSSNLVIVAIPAADDPIWKISSEKIPHLTLLFLGDAENNPKINLIYQFVWHAVNVMEHGPFYLDVDRRDILGEDKADVIHFRKDWSFKWLEQFRNQLLQHSDIRTAYDSAEQFPKWQPHLTLGYPETPANEDKIPDYGFGMVRFDRIAVWTGNYEGPEFRLEWPEREEAMAVAYSETGQAVVADLLHVGVKGMKWGVRKTETITTSDGKTQTVTPRKAAKADQKWKKDFESNKKAIEAHNMMADEMDGFTKTYNEKWKNIDLTKDPAKQQEYDDGYFKEIERSYGRAYEKVYGTSPSGKHRVSYDAETNLIRLHKVDEAKHADELVVAFRITRNAKGLITKVEPVEEALVQTAIHGGEFVNNLMHYGVKGMKWGVRKAPPEPVAPTAVSRVPQGAKRKTKIEVEGGENHEASPDAIKVAQSKAKLKKSGPAALTNKELQEVANRVELEQRVKRAVQPSGQKFVTNLLRNQGNQGANQFVSKQVKKKFIPA